MNSNNNMTITSTPNTEFLNLWLEPQATTTCQVELDEILKKDLEADIVLIVDESGSMGNKQAWIPNMVSKLQECFDKVNIKARYTIVGFGNNNNNQYLGRTVDLGTGQRRWGISSDITQQLYTLHTYGGEEDGYAGIDFAIKNLDFRKNAAKHFIVITDEPRTNVLEEIGVEDIVNLLADNNVTLHTIVSASFKAGTKEALGGKSGNIAFVKEDKGEFSESDNLIILRPNNSSSGSSSEDDDTTVQDYVDLVLEETVKKGTSWDINKLYGNDADTIKSFTNAFTSVLWQEVMKEFAFIVSNDPDISVEILSYDILEGKFQFQLKLENNSSLKSPKSFSLLSVNGNEYENLENPGIVYGVVRMGVSTEYVYQVLANDPDGDSLTYTLLGENHGANLHPSTGYMTWKPQAAGEYDFKVRVSDGYGGTDEQPWTVTVTNIAAPNDPPLFDSSPEKTILNFVSGERCGFRAVAADSDVGDTPLRYYLMYNHDDQCRYPDGMSINHETGEVTWEIAPWDFGQFTVVIMAMDARGAFSTQKYYCNVARKITKVNNPPVIPKQSTYEATAGEAFEEYFTAYDPDGDRIIYELINPPKGLQISPLSGKMTWTPSPNQAGFHQIRAKVTDEHDKFQTRDFWIEVHPFIPLRFSSYPEMGPLSLGDTWRYQTQISYKESCKPHVTYTFNTELLESDAEQSPPSTVPGMTWDGVTKSVIWNTDDVDNMLDGTHLYLITIRAYDNDDHDGFIEPHYEEDIQRFCLLVSKQTFGQTIDKQEGDSSDYINPISDPSGEESEETFHLFIGQDPEFTIQLSQDARIAYQLSGQPQGMIYDAQNRTITWSPTKENVGKNYTAILKTSYMTYDNEWTDFDLNKQTLNFLVSDAQFPSFVPFEQPPYFVVGEEYHFKVTAMDPNEGGKVTYAFEDGELYNYPLDSEDNIRIEIDPDTGDINWVPQSEDAQQVYEVCVEAKGSTGLSATRSFKLSDRALAALDLKTDPDSILVAEREWSYTITATTSIIPLTANDFTGPEGMTFNETSQTFSWTPTWEQISHEDHELIFKIDNGTANMQITHYLTVIEPASITPIPDQIIVADEPYEYQVDASEFKDDIPSYSINGPDGIQIDPWGKITWTPTIDQVSATDYAVTVDVEYGDVRSILNTGFNLKVVEATTPLITITGPKIVKDQGNVTLNVIASTAHGTPSVKLNALNFINPDGQVQRLDYVKNDVLTTPEIPMNAQFQLKNTTLPNGDKRFGPNGPNDFSGGIVHFRATATIADKVGISDYYLYVAKSNVSDSTPYVNIAFPTDTSPTDTNGLKAPFEIRGAVFGRQDNVPESVSWTLTMVEVQENNYEMQLSDVTVLAEGEDEISGVLAKIDTTLIRDGHYQLKLETTSGSVSCKRNIKIDAPLKLGNYAVSFVDYESKLPNFPIKITRTYDSLDIDKKGDFGYGWSCDINGIKGLETLGGYSLTFSHDGNSMGISLNSSSVKASLKTGAKLYLALPDGNKEIFTFQPKAYGGKYLPQFVNDNAMSKCMILDSPDVLLVKDGEIYHGIDNYTEYFTLSTFGTHLKFVTDEGSLVQFTLKEKNFPLPDETIHKSVGDLIIDDKILIHPGIITSNTSTFSVVYMDVNNNYQRYIMDFTLRNKVIKEIQTPEGARIVYGHDNQNAPQILESVKKYQGLDLISEVEFGYDNDKRLTSITDSMGRNVAQTIYENGRIKEVIDADENVTGYTFNTSRNTQIVKTKADKDADTWFETELRLDGSGNILYEKTPGGAETYYKYKGNLLVEKKVSTTNQDRPVSLTTTYRHNSNGQIIEETDPQGNVTENEYNEYGQLTAAKRNGVSVSSTMYDYDSKLPIRSTDANGNTTNYKYVGQNLTEIRSGSETLVKNHYNTYGQIEKTIANNRETSFLYDTAGNCTQTSYTEQDETISDHTTYDSMGRVLSHSRQVGASTTWTTTTVYDPEGQVSSETDQNGMTTIYKYDACGRKVQTITQVRDSDENSVPVSLYSETCYDAMGRVIASTENHLSAASNVLGTINEYDADGRVIKTEQHKGMVITVTDINNHVSTSVLTTEGTLLSVTITDYNSAGWVTSSFDQYGLETRYTYDDFGNTIQVARQSPVEKSSPNEGWDMKWLVSRTVYDKFGRVSIATDQFVVELEANLLENMSPPAYATKTLYDAQGRVIESVRLTGVTVKIDIKTSQEELDDAFKDKPNIAAVLVLPGAKVHTSVTRYNEKGQVAKTISPEGVATFYEYDDLGRQTKTVTNHLQTVTEYDKMGRVARVCVSNVADPDNKRTTAYAYDPFGNIAMTQFPNNSSIRATFNAKGQKTSETNQMGHTRRFEYDSQGRLIKVTMPRANDSDSVGSEPVYEYAYDSLGNQTLIRDPLGRETRFTYDSRGNQLTRTLPLGYGTNGKWDSGESLVPATHTERFEYDEYGRQILHIAFEGAHTKSEYDSYGRLATKKFYTNAANYAAGTVVDIWTYKYDVFGRETSLTQAWSGMRNWTTTTTYDVLGRITKHKRPNQYGILKYEYDHFGRQTSATLSIDETTTANDKATTYEYDGWGRLWKVEDHDGQLTTYEYDVFGNRSSTTLPNDVVTTYAYDNMNRLLVEESKKGATLVSKFEYTYTDLGQKTKATETHRIAGVDKSIVTQWEYDDLSRLTKETLTHYTPANSKTQTWEYDAVGNRTQQACGTQTTSYTYNVNDQLTDELLTDSSVSANARLTKRTYSASRVTQEICYRGTDEVSANRLWQKDHSYQHDGPHYVTTLYHWNGMGTFLRREYVRSLANADGLVMMTDYYTNDSGVNSTAWTSKFRSIYLYDHFNSTGYAQVVRETYNDTLSGTVLVRTHSHTFGHDRISETTTLVSQPNDPQKVFFLHDGLGNTRALTSANGTIAQRYDYDAFGNAIGFEPGEALTRFLYCGELFDHKLGWTYLRARYYDPKVGRFNRLDPFFGVISDPQSLHKYTYCHGDPVNHTDPSGRFLAISMSSVGIGAAIGGLIGAGLGAYRDGWQGALVGALAGGASGAAAGLFSPALAAAFGKSILGYMGYGATTGLIGGFTHGGIYGTLLPHGNFGFDLKNGMGLALFEGVTGMFAGMILGPIGYIFGKAPKPSGTPDPELKREMIKMANSTFFRARANVWSKITGRGRINWDKLTTKLEKAEFRQFADAKEAGRSGGWAGLGDDGNWLFAVNRSWGGKTTMAHELFHGVQDIQASIFSRSMGPLGIAASETTAHLFGGPLIGVPASGIAFLIGWGLFAAVDIWLDVYETLPDIQ